MTTPAVQERPATQTTSEAESVVASEDREVTANDTEVQPNSEQETTEQPDEVVTPPDPRQARVQALADAERDEIRQQARDEAIAELTGQTPERQRELQRQKVRNSFVTEAQALDDLINDENLSPAQIVQKAKNSLNNLNKVALDAATDQVAEDVQRVAYGLLPKDAQEAFTNLTQGEVDLPTYLNNWVEVAALHTKAVKSMDLEAAIKSSSKIKREVEAAKLASYDEGREQGRLDPAGTSPDGGRGNQRGAPGGKTYIQLEEGYGAGTLTKSEEAEYNKLREARKRS